MTSSSGAGNNAADQQRPCCLRCRQPLPNCFCNLVVPQQTSATFIFLQHPAEARNPVGTARMAHFSLPGSYLFVGVNFEDNERLRQLLSQFPNAGILFPSPDAADLETLRHAEGSCALIVIDGTWSQAAKIWKTNSFLRSLPAYRLTPSQPSRYRIRAEPLPHCVSTIEATAAALTALDGLPHEDMLRPFLAMVERQVAYREASTRSPRRCVRKKKQPFMPPMIAKGLQNILFVHSISDGSKVPKPGKSRMAALAAFRPSTGEIFFQEAAPTVKERAETRDFCAGKAGEEQNAVFANDASDGSEQKGAAVSDADLHEAWKKFIRDDDVWVIWSPLTTDLMRAAEIPVQRTSELKHWCACILKKSPGSLTDAERLFFGNRNDAVSASAEAAMPGKSSVPSLGEGWKSSRLQQDLEKMRRLLHSLLRRTVLSAETSAAADSVPVTLCRQDLVPNFSRKADFPELSSERADSECSVLPSS